MIPFSSTQHRKRNPQPSNQQTIKKRTPAGYHPHNKLLFLPRHKTGEKLLPPIREPLLRLPIIDHRALPPRVVPLRDLDLLLARLEDVRCAAAADVCAVCGFAAGMAGGWMLATLLCFYHFQSKSNSAAV
jgi:hypothetical protein